MPQEAIIRLVIGCLFFSLIYAAFIKFFERRLTFLQAYLIALVVNVALGIPLGAYTFAKPQLNVSPGLDFSVSVAAMVLAAFMITRLAANHGIKKEGRFGLGAKVVFASFLMMLIFLIALAGLSLLLRGWLHSGT